MKKDKAPRNKTIELTKAEINEYGKRAIKISARVSLDFVLNKTLHQDTFKALDLLPEDSMIQSI